VRETELLPSLIKTHCYVFSRKYVSTEMYMTLFVRLSRNPDNETDREKNCFRN